MLKALAVTTIIFMAHSSFALDCAGTEPFWGATLTDKNMTITTPDDQKERTLPITKIERAAGMAEDFLQIYSNEQGAVAVVRKTGNCTDGMSEGIYPQEVILLQGADVKMYGCCGEPRFEEEQQLPPPPCGDAETGGCHP